MEENKRNIFKKIQNFKKSKITEVEFEPNGNVLEENNDNVRPKKRIGTIIKFNESTGYGFIKLNNSDNKSSDTNLTNKDIYFNYKKVKNKPIEEVRVGQLVKFYLINKEDRIFATSIYILK